MRRRTHAGETVERYDTVRLRKDGQRIGVSLTVSPLATRKSDPDVVLRDALAATLDASGISKGALILRDATGVLALRQAIGFSEAERSKLQTFFGHAVWLEAIVNRRGASRFRHPPFRRAPRGDILAGANVTAAQIVPLISDGRGVGAMLIGATSKDVTSDDSVAFARAMGNQVCNRWSSCDPWPVCL